MIDSIAVRNFKAFGDAAVRLDLKPLTIILGPNGSGKTAALEALGLFSQTASRQYHERGFRWNGPWCNLGVDGKAAFHNRDTSCELEIGCGIALGEHFRTWYQQHAGSDVPVNKSVEYRIAYRESSRE